jgi:prophage tail gpP-like protein
MDAPELILTVGDRDYRGWLSVMVERSVDTAAIQFGVIGTRDWPGMEQAWDFQPGDACTVHLGEHLMATGWVDQMSPSYDDSSHQIEIVGRGLVSDLVDCPPEGAPTEWKKAPPGQIITTLAGVYQVGVVIETDLGAPLDFKVQQGESTWEAIERITRLRQVLAYEQHDGTLLITRVSTEYCDTDLVQGGNVKSASALLDDRERHSVIIVKGQQAGADNVSPAQAAQSRGQMTDPSITRYRPLVIYQAAKTSNADAQKRAQWEVANRWGNGRSATIIVQGWFTDEGVPWPINRICRIEDSWLGLDREMTITKASFRLGASGTITQLTLQPPEALTPNPDDLKPEKKGAGGGSTDFWRQVGADREAGERRRKESKQ